MSKELRKPTINMPAIDLDALNKGIEQIGQVVEQLEARQGPPLLRFTRDGSWVVGAANEPVAPGTKAVVHLDKLKSGFIAWKAGRPVGEVMKSLLLEGPVDPSSLQPTDAPRGWEPQVAIGLTLLDDGLEVEFKSSSAGGRQAFTSLLKRIYVQRREEPARIIPVVALERGSYTHPDYGVIYTPKFDVVGWLDVPTALDEPPF